MIFWLGAPRAKGVKTAKRWPRLSKSRSDSRIAVASSASVRLPSIPSTTSSKFACASLLASDASAVSAFFRRAFRFSPQRFRSASANTLSSRYLRFWDFRCRSRLRSRTQSSCLQNMCVSGFRRHLFSIRPHRAQLIVFLRFAIRCFLRRKSNNLTLNSQSRNKGRKSEANGNRGSFI